MLESKRPPVEAAAGIYRDCLARRSEDSPGAEDDQVRLTREDLAALFNERAGIIEFDSRVPRPIAEVNAFWEIFAEASCRGCDRAAVTFLGRLCEMVHIDLDLKLLGLLDAMRAAA